jgi:AAA family ATP:ADP antiporter
MRATRSLPDFKTVGGEPKNGLERLLSYFADVRAGEGAGVVLLTANVFLLLFAYYLLKTVREALILTEGGAYVKAYSSAGQAVLLMAIVPLYGFIATKLNRMKLIAGLLAFFITNLLAFYILGVGGAKEGVAFYIWVGIFNVFVISQFWALATDLYTEGQGKRLFAMIGVGSSMGAWLGAQAAERLVRAGGFSPYQIQLIGAAFLVVCAILIVAANRTVTRHSIPEMARQDSKPLSGGDGFALIAKSRYLALIAVLVVLLNLVNSTGEFLLGKLISEQAQTLYPADMAAQQTFVGGFYGSFFAGVNLLGFLLQAFAVSRLFATVGVRGTLYLLPAIALLSYSVLAFVPLLGLVRITKTLENATDYSVNNTVRQALFLPTTREAKYKAKAAIDAFFMRFGDVLQAGVVRIGAELQLAFTGFAWINVALTIAWLWVVSRLAKQHRQMGF